MFRLKHDFEDIGSSLNIKPAWTFSLRLRRRLMLREMGKVDKSVDVLITGCEVSLWAGEQFASDLHLAFPSLKIVTLSANKLLGMLGQKFTIPQEGFMFNGQSYSFRNTIVLLISQSGGTFTTLAVANLLRAVTPDLFSISSEWDTQVARSVRERPRHADSNSGKVTSLFASYTFSTFAGLRPAEPCTLSLVATHALLTHLLIFSMNYLAETRLGGSTYEAQEVQELHGFHESHIKAVRSIVGIGSNLHDSEPSDASRSLRAQGRRWAQHILEAPIAWILSAFYIAITVIVGAAPISTIHAAATAGLGLSTSASSTASCGATSNASTAAAAATSGASTATSPVALVAAAYVAKAFDAVLYVFLPIWMTWLLRAIQGRPMLHRVAGRSLLIGDIPFVAQSIEAYVSKLFALSYSIATISVASANPTDHLVHRHTHRVVRGSLLAVGRPDARLNALTTADTATCLAINQACAITNLGAGCEAITVGHDANKPDMVDACLVLPATRPKFISEFAFADKGGFVHAQLGGQITVNRRKNVKLMINIPTPNSSSHRGASSRSGEEKSDRSSSSTSSDRIASPAMRRKSQAVDLSKSFVKRLATASVFEGDAQIKSSAGPMAVLGQMAALKRDERDGTPPSHVHRRMKVTASECSFHQRMKDEVSSLRARMTVEKLREPYVGAWMQHSPAFEHLSVAQMMDRQRNLQHLYETRFASLQRMVAFMVMFHSMGKAVQDFWPWVSCGLLRYNMSRSQSMLRVASTAAPVSGSEVRDRILELEREELEQWAARCIQRAVRWTLVLRKRLASNANRIIFEQGGAQSEQTMLAAELVAALPELYLISTTTDERQVHLELYTKYKQVTNANILAATNAHEHVFVAWRRRGMRVLLCLVFLDCIGSLSSITAFLSSRGIDIKRVAAFSTRHGVAVDTFEVDLRFDDATAELLRAHVSQLQSQLTSMSSISALARLLPDSYMQSTTLDDRRVHFELYQKYEARVIASAGGDDVVGAAAHEGRVQMSWSFGRTSTMLYIVYDDMLGSLGLIANVLREFGVNIQNLAAFCTSDEVAVDTISVTPNFSATIGAALKASLLNALELRELHSVGEMAPFIASMPEHYLTSTTSDERDAHLELYRRLEQSSSKDDVQMTWKANRRSSARTSYILHLTFLDTTGSLAVITTTLLEVGVGILRAGIYCTHEGVAVDTFELSSFSSATADLLTARLSAHISGHHGWIQSLARTLTGQSTAQPSNRSSPMSASPPTQRPTPNNTSESSLLTAFSPAGASSSKAQTRATCVGVLEC